MRGNRVPHNVRAAELDHGRLRVRAEEGDERPRTDYKDGSDGASFESFDRPRRASLEIDEAKRRRPPEIAVLYASTR